jgi:pseudaminic acid cytidylyltransferase
MANIAIIPARGGSKRIPGKNIKLFHGEPIIAYSIRTAIESKLFDEVMVSTDNLEIAEIAVFKGASVPFLRSKENSNDFATTFSVVTEVLREYKEKENKVFNNSCCIYPTAPLIKVEDLIAGYRKLITCGYTSVIPIVSFSYPVWRGVIIDEDRIKMKWPKYLNHRSQDLPKLFHDAGQWYWLNNHGKARSFFTKNTGYIELSDEFVLYIDNFSDWEIA